MIVRTLYETSATLAAPFLSHLLSKRARRGKEDPARLPERYGIASLPRPVGPLVWIHAASNGESMSALPLIERLLQDQSDRAVLMTTGTVTSAKLMADRLPSRAFHQYVPLDRPAWVRAFLKHWRPDLGIWIESEFWPSLIWEMRRAGRPMALINGRISERSLTRWQKRPGLARDLLSDFAPVLTQTELDARHLASLGAQEPECVGNLKLAGAPLPADPTALQALKQSIGERPVWVAASTHPGEEEIVLQAHQHLQTSYPDLLTILVPRHPQRGEDVSALIQSYGLSQARRSLGQTLTEDHSVYLADTLGELGLFYRVVPVAFIGGSIAGNHGGHNPLEAAHLDCSVLHGPDMHNFSTVAQDLSEKGIAKTVPTAHALSEAVGAVLSGQAAPLDAHHSISEALASDGEKTLNAVMERLTPLLTPKASA